MGFDGGGLSGFLSKAKNDVTKAKDKFVSDVTSPRSKAQLQDMKQPINAAKSYATKGTTGPNEDAELAKEAPKAAPKKRGKFPPKKAEGGGGVYPAGTKPNFSNKPRN